MSHILNESAENYLETILVLSKRLPVVRSVDVANQLDFKKSSVSIAMKNLIAFARKRGGKSMADKLASEIVDAFNNQGGAYKRKEDMHRMAEANRAFAHFRF